MNRKGHLLVSALSPTKFYFYVTNISLWKIQRLKHILLLSVMDPQDLFYVPAFKQTLEEPLQYADPQRVPPFLKSRAHSFNISETELLGSSTAVSHHEFCPVSSTEKDSCSETFTLFRDPCTSVSICSLFKTRVGFISQLECSTGKPLG